MDIKFASKELTL